MSSNAAHPDVVNQRLRETFYLANIVFSVLLASSALIFAVPALTYSLLTGWAGFFWFLSPYVFIAVMSKTKIDDNNPMHCSLFLAALSFCVAMNLNVVLHLLVPEVAGFGLLVPSLCFAILAAYVQFSKVTPSATLVYSVLLITSAIAGGITSIVGTPLVASMVVISVVSGIIIGGWIALTPKFEQLLAEVPTYASVATNVATLFLTVIMLPISAYNAVKRRN